MHYLANLIISDFFSFLCVCGIYSIAFCQSNNQKIQIILQLDKP